MAGLGMVQSWPVDGESWVPPYQVVLGCVGLVTAGGACCWNGGEDGIKRVIRMCLHINSL